MAASFGSVLLESESSLDQALAVPEAEKASKETPGNMAVWVLIYAELFEFALFFIAFLIAKSHFPVVFSDGPLQLNTFAGTANTLVLITSSFFVARAMAAIKLGKRHECLTWLWLTLAAGSVYCGIKGWEYSWNEAAGIGARRNTFFTLYYYLTLNHLLHVLMGMCTILFVTIRTHMDIYDATNYEGLESAALYWHMIDLVWIIIFPLLYVLR